MEDACFNVSRMLITIFEARSWLRVSVAATCCHRAAYPIYFLINQSMQTDGALRRYNLKPCFKRLSYRRSMRARYYSNTRSLSLVGNFTIKCLGVWAAIFHAFPSQTITSFCAVYGNPFKVVTSRPIFCLHQVPCRSSSGPAASHKTGRTSLVDGLLESDLGS
ncbi:uncharacterized protein EV420DRAFT_1505313 [Desarmillaria tabescens]|uniref:Uncharacterized protein n=1 Tax=Armillaria tabescens TaxID=1929756 RepID=A0AA39NJH9_ARMTA|nr:uncharacterized protein EV420DRAFT_1505313 [Desarmillaria tabescens]KAK0466780.1 hypothetical protein EV420DRAFT_1505313 [Desarmillaria tabescens]